MIDTLIIAGCIIAQISLLFVANWAGYTRGRREGYRQGRTDGFAALSQRLTELKRREIAHGQKDG